MANHFDFGVIHIIHIILHVPIAKLIWIIRHVMLEANFIVFHVMTRWEFQYVQHVVVQ